MKYELKIWCKGHFEISHEEFVFENTLYQRRQDELAAYLNIHYPDWKEAMLTITSISKNGKIHYNRTHIEHA